MPSHYGSTPTLQDLIERSGIDPKFFEEGGASEFAQQLGLKGKGLEGFSRFADIMKFQPERIEKLLSSIGEFGKEQRGFIQEQFALGSEAARSGFGRGLESLRTSQLGQMAGARQQTGGFAGAGAQQRALGLLSQAGQRQLSGLETGLSEQLQRLSGARERGLSGVEQQVEARIGQTQGLLGDYISRLTQLGSQFLALDPTEAVDTSVGGVTEVDIPGSGIPSSQEDKIAQSEGWPSADAKKKWMNAGAYMGDREQYGWKRPQGG